MTEEIEFENGKVRTQQLTKKKRGRKLMDQKANSVADMACVLGAIGTDKPWGTKGMEDSGEGTVVEIRWGNVADAEFAETWSGEVLHDVLPRGRDVAYGEIIAAIEAERARRRAKREAEGNGYHKYARATV
jgi:hypothetical protein